jgi:hypothetical protein
MVAKVANSKQSRLAWHCLPLVFLMMGCITAMGQQYNGGYGDVAGNKSTSASCSTSDSYLPQNATNRASGYWTCHQVTPNNLYVDLGGNYYLNGYGLKMDNSNELPKYYNFYVSNDNSNWTYITGTTNSSTGTLTYNFALTGPWRYVQLNITEKSYYGSVDEFYVYGTLSACTNPTSGGTIAAAQSGCTTFDPAAFTSSAAASGHSGTLEYKWQYAVSPFSTWNDIVSTNSATYDPPSGLTVTTRYKRLARVGCKTDWTGAAVSNVLEAAVSPASAGGTAKW